MHDETPVTRSTAEQQRGSLRNALADELPDAVVVVNAAGRILFANRSACDLFRWTTGEIIGQPFAILVPQRDVADSAGAPTHSQEWPRIKGPTTIEVVARERTGRRFPAEIRYACFQAGEWLMVAVIRRRDGALRSHVDNETVFFRTMVESSQDAIVCASPAGIVLVWNAGAEKLYGYSAAEMVGQSMLITVPPERASEAADWLARVRAGETVSGRTVRRRKDGRLIEVEPSLWPVYDSGGSLLGLASTIHDIGERVRLEHKLDDAHRLGAMGRLAATVAHEFNNVLMAIGPYVDVIRRMAGSDPKVESALRHIAAALLRGRNITAEVLRFSRPSPAHLVPFDAVQWLRRLGEELGQLMPPRINLRVTPIEGSVELLGDEQQLTQAVTNLVLNARDALGRRKGNILLEMALSYDRRALMLTVRDDGPGIAPEVLGEIFEPLFTTKSTGTGLGLPVSRQIVSRHGGKISVKSDPTGTEFEITLPLTDQEERRALTA